MRTRQKDKCGISSPLNLRKANGPAAHSGVRHMISPLFCCTTARPVVKIELRFAGFCRVNLWHCH
jgi:hypothetical protein